MNTKSTITIQPQARLCMEKLGISQEDVVTTITEWESQNVIATDPNTANTIAIYPEKADDIPAFYISERTLYDRNLTLIVYSSTSIKSHQGKTKITVAVHWVSVQPPLDSRFVATSEVNPSEDWLEPKKTN
jgi:hypothetical protein